MLFSYCFCQQVWFQEYARLKLCLAQIKCLGVNTRKDLNEANYKCKYTPGSLLHFSSLLGLGVDRISDLIGIYIYLVSGICRDARYLVGYLAGYPVSERIYYLVSSLSGYMVFGLAPDILSSFHIRTLWHRLVTLVKIFF